MVLSVHECVIEPLGAAGRNDLPPPVPESEPRLWSARVVAGFGTAKVRLTASVCDAVPTAWGVPEPVVAEAAEACCKRVYDIGPALSVFDWWGKLHADTGRHAVTALPVNEQGNDPGGHVWARRSATLFVRALVERALVLALQQATGATVEQVLEKNLLKIDLGKIYRPLVWQSTSTLLPKPLKNKPRRLIRLRAEGAEAFFAVTKAALAQQQGAEGGSSQEGGGAVAAVAAPVVPQGFVLSLTGDAATDAEWVLGALECSRSIGLPVNRMYWGLDGEGRYEHADSFADFWSTLERNGALAAETFGRPAFVIQPLASGLALGNAMVALFARWPRRPSVLLDGGHDSPLSGALALDRGYGGFCFRGARGPILSVADACLLALRQKHEPIGKWLLLGGGSATTFAEPWAEQAAWQRVLGLGDVITPLGLEP